MTDHASSDVVMIEWIKQVVGIAPAAGTLPNPESWYTTGFVTVPGIVGGNDGLYLPERKPVMQVDTHAAARSASGAATASRRPPLGLASALAERIVSATYLPVGPIVLSSRYYPVWIESIYPVSSVRRIPESDTGYAHFTVDIALNWIEQVPVI